MNTPRTHGVLHIHAAPASLCPHIRWALESVVGCTPEPQWSPQFALPGQVRTALRQLGNLRFEIHEEARPGSDAGRWAYTPGLGIFWAMTDAAGNTVITEDRVRCAYESAQGDPQALLRQFSLALGEAWDEELEPLRECVSAPENVRVLHRVS